MTKDLFCYSIYSNNVKMKVMLILKVNRIED